VLQNFDISTTNGLGCHLGAKIDLISASQSRLGQLIVVQEDVAPQGLRQILPGEEVMRLQDIADAAIEAFDHAVGLRGPRFGQ